MTLWSCNVGTSWVIVKAGDTNAARFAVAERLGITARPWLWRDLSVRRATARDIDRYGALADATTGRKLKGKTAREPTAKKLKRDNVVELFPDSPDTWFPDDGGNAA